MTTTNAEARQLLAAESAAATARIAAILGGDLRAARRVVSRLSPAQRWVAGHGDAEARAVLRSYVIHHGEPLARAKAGRGRQGYRIAGSACARIRGTPQRR